METSLFHPAYFGPLDQYIAMSKADSISFEMHDNYQKQTYRNRQYIYGANGRLQLNIPVKHRKDTHKRQLYKDVKIEQSFKWQQLHWKSIQTAYRTSPFFEFYEDDFAFLFEKPATYLMDYNLKCTEVVAEALGVDFNFKFTDEYKLDYSANNEVKDERRFISAKRSAFYEISEYNQVFKSKYGFIPNLCVLDVLFNLGPSAEVYFDQIK